jgi:hypothetical protein
MERVREEGKSSTAGGQVARATLLFLTLYPSRLMWLGILLYFLGTLLPRDPLTGFARLVLQRLGFASGLEGFLLFVLAKTANPIFPPLWVTLLIGSAMLIGVPALVVWQLKRIRLVEHTGRTGVAEQRVKAAQRPHRVLIATTAILVMGFLGLFGYMVGGLIGPGQREGFEPSPMGQAIGLLGGSLLGLAMVGYAARESS